MKLKKLISLFLAIMMVAATFPAVSANEDTQGTVRQDNDPLQEEGGGDGTGADGDEPGNTEMPVTVDNVFSLEYGKIMIEPGALGKLKITQNGEYRGDGYEGDIIITGVFDTQTYPPNKDTDNTHVIGFADVTCNVILKDVTVDVSGLKGVTPLALLPGSSTNVTITLEGNNTLKASEVRSGVFVSEGSTVTIQGDGSLTAVGSGYSAPAIGPSFSKRSGVINIMGGTIYAYPSGNSYGIGGGQSETYPSSVTISGENTKVYITSDIQALIGVGVNAHITDGAMVDFRGGGNPFSTDSATIGKCTITGDGSLAGTYSPVTVTGGTAAVADRPVYWGETIVKSGTTVTLTPSTPAEVWEEGSWILPPELELKLGQDGSFVMPTEAVTATYTKTKKTYSITYENLGGANSNNPARYQYGTAVTLLSPGYRASFAFDGWTDGAGQSVTEIAANEYGDKVFYANWKPVFGGKDPQILLDRGSYLLDYGATGITVRVYDNMKAGIDGQPVKYRTTVTGTDSSKTVIENPRENGDYTEFIFPFGEELNKLQSGYENGEYKPVYTVKVEAFIDNYDKPSFISAEAKGYLLPPVVTVSLDGTVPSVIPVAEARTLTVPFIIENLSDTAGSSIAYKIFKNGALIASGTELSSSTTTTVDGIRTIRGTVEVPLNIPENIEDIYRIEVSGQNSGQTPSSYSRQIKVVDSSLSLLTVTYINSANEPTSNPKNIQGALLSELASMTAQDGYESEGVYKYLLANRLENNRLTLDAPEAWGRVRYRVGDGAFSSWMSPAAAYALTYRQGASTTFTFEWEHSEVEYTLGAKNDSLSGKVYLVKVAKGFTAPSFRWQEGGRTVQKTVTPTAEGICVLYAPNGITNLEITGTKGETSYTAAVENPASLSFAGSGATVSRLKSLTLSDYRNAAPYLTSTYVNLVSNPGVRLSFVEHDGAALSGPVNVNFFVVDQGLKPVETTAFSSTGDVTVAPGGFASIGIKALSENKTNLILAEITRTGKKPMLYLLDYQTVSALGSANQEKDILIKLGLPRENGNQLSIQPAILRDESGTRVLYGSTSVAADFFDGTGASYTVIVPQTAVSGSLTDLKLETGTLISLKQTAAVVLDSTTLPRLKNSYVMATYDLKDRFAQDQTHTNIRLVDGGNTVANFVGLVSRSVSDNILDLLNSSFTLPALPDFNFDDLKGHSGLGAFAGAIGDFEIETPAWGPINFAVIKEGDCYVIKGVASISALPDSGHESLESAAEILNMFTSISNQFTAGQGSKLEISDSFLRPMGGGDVFIGFRLFLSIRATLNKETGFWDFEFNDGGVIGELSGSVTSRTRVAGIAEYVQSISGKAIATISMAYPTKEYRSRATGIPLIDFALEAELAAALSARVGVGLDIWVASAYAGIQGGAGISYKNKTISRPYLPSNDVEWLQAGMLTTLNGNISLYVTKQFLLWSQTDTYPLLDANLNIYNPDNATNPYKPANGKMAPMSTGLVPVNARMSTMGLSGYASLIDGVDTTAAAQYAAGDILYKDIGNVSDLNDDRIKSNKTGVSISSSPIGPEYNPSVSTGAGKALAAWEAIDGKVNASGKESMVTTEAVNHYLAKTEIIGAYYDGSSWKTTRLSNNDMMDMGPKTAYNEADNRGIVVWTRGDAAASQGEGGKIDLSVSGELVCSLFNGTGFSQPISLRSLSQSAEKQVVAVAPAVAGDGSSVVVLQTADGHIAYITISADGKTVQYVDPGIVAEGVDLIWNGEKLVLGYVTAESDASSLVLLTSANGQDAFVSTDIPSALEGRIGAGFRFTRDLSAVGMDSLAVVWHEFADGTAQFLGSILMPVDQAKYQFSAPQVIGTAPDTYTVASFDSQFEKSSNTISILAVYATQGMSAHVAEESASMENKVKAAIFSVDTENLRPGRSSDITLIVQNDGLVPITELSVTMGDNEKVFRTVQLAQGTSTYVTVPYTPAAGMPLSSALDFTVDATYQGGGTASFNQTHNLYMVDVAVSLLNFTNTEAEGSVMVNLASGADLIVSSESKIKLGVYSDPYGEEPAGDTRVLTGAQLNTMMDTGLVQSLKVNSVAQKNQLYVIASTVDGADAPVRDVNQANNQIKILMEPNGGSSGVTGIQLSDETVSLSRGATHQLTAVVTPDNANNTEVVWSSSSPAVATVKKDGTITAVSAGRTVITAASADGSASAQCEVRVRGVVIDFPADNHTVSFNSQGGTGVADQSVEPGQLAVAPKNPTRAGYVFSGWYLEAACSNAYDFNTPVTQALTLYAGWQKGAEEVADPFSDIGGHWANQVIHTLYNQGIIMGYEDGTFRPQSGVTRAEFAVLLCRALKLSGTDTPQHLFEDDANIPSWARAELYLCKEWGIMQGDQGGKVHAGQPITRQDMFVMVSRMLAVQGKLGTAEGTDGLALYGDRSDVAEYAALHIEALLQAGLIQGSDGKLNPQKGSTRAETAQLLFNLLSSVE